MHPQPYSSEYQRLRAITRWKNKRQCIKRHLASVPLEEYKLLKARLHAYIAADGSLLLQEYKGRSTTHHEIMFYPDHVVLAELFSTAFERLYSQKVRINKDKNYYRLRVGSWVACDDLLKDGKFRALEWEVPLVFLDTKELQQEWLRGFFDCEGYVSPKCIRVESVCERGIRQIQILLENFGIFSHIYKYVRKNPNWNTNFILNIGRKEMRRLFLKEIGFNHPVKLEKLRKQFYADALELS